MFVNRRGLLVGLGSLVAAPAIVRATSLMPVKALDWWDGAEITCGIDDNGVFWTTYRNEFIASFEQRCSLLRAMVVREAVVPSSDVVFTVA